MEDQQEPINQELQQDEAPEVDTSIAEIAAEEPATSAEEPPKKHGDDEVTAQATEEAIDWSFKFNDEVRQVPDEYRSWVKAKEDAERLKDIYQRAEALEYHKTQTSELKQSIQAYEEKLGEYRPVMENLQKLDEYYKKGEDERVMQALGYDEERILKLAKVFLDRKQMPESERRLFEEKRQRDLDLENQQSYTENIKQQAERQLRELTTVQVDAELGKEGVRQVAEMYDAKFGAGKFRELVWQQGDLLFSSRGYVSPTELVPMVVQQFTPFIQSQVAGATQKPQAEALVVTTKPKVIPNVKGTGQSVGRNQYTSLDDLRKKRLELVAMRGE